MLVTRMLHCSFLVKDIGVSIEFYQTILNLQLNPMRPDLGYPGAWFDVGDQQIHLLQLSNPDSTSQRPEHAGRDRHVALAVTDAEKLEKLLKHNKIAFTRSHSGRNAIFFRDPDGNAIEAVQVVI